LSTGDQAKQILFRFRNLSKLTLTGVVLDMRFQRPLTLSGTDRAVSVIPGKTKHGRVRVPGNTYYYILHSELDILGEDSFDYGVELDTKGQAPGTYTVLITAYTTQQDYKYKRFKLSIEMT